MPVDLIEAHKHSSNHREVVLAGSQCGCFYCCQTFSPETIREWIDAGQTALCPRCGIDSVLGDKAGLPLTQAFLGDMNAYWFAEGRGLVDRGVD